MEQLISPMTHALFMVVTLASTASAAQSGPVERWGRNVTSFSTSTYDGNPFEVLLAADFTHTASGLTLQTPGYYAGDDEWRIAFMPVEVGEWTYVTLASEPTLVGLTGSFDVVEAEQPRRGLLKGSQTHPRKWQFSNGEFVLPVGIMLSVMMDDASDTVFTEAADFLANTVKGTWFTFRLNPNDAAFSNVAQREMDLGMWDRLEARMDILAERNLGANIMFYTDDGGTPSFGGQSTTEALLIRYAVARLAAYPIVVFNTGVDIAEYRSGQDISWLGNRIGVLDPYTHPRSSRHGGGSGDNVMAGQTFDSRGVSTAPMNTLLQHYSQSPNLPVCEDDNWGEEWDRRGNFSVGDIRRAFWKLTVAGGLAGNIRDDNLNDFPGAVDPDAWFRAVNVHTKLGSATSLGRIDPFIQEKLGPLYGEMEQANHFAPGSGKYCLANSLHTRLLFLYTGRWDQFDPSSGNLDLDLAAVHPSIDLDAVWFDPRNASEVSAGTLSGGQSHSLTPAVDDDWILLLSRCHDADGDGFGAVGHAGCSAGAARDCADSDEDRNPGATEICGDGIDQDCDGSDLVCPEDGGDDTGDSDTRPGDAQDGDLDG